MPSQQRPAQESLLAPTLVVQFDSLIAQEKNATATAAEAMAAAGEGEDDKDAAEEGDAEEAAPEAAA